jgi:hypothetical protein
MPSTYTKDLHVYIDNKIGAILHALELIDPLWAREDSVAEYLHKFRVALEEAVYEDDEEEEE